MPLVDWIPYKLRNYYGVSSFALSATNQSQITAALGAYVENTGVLVRSNDRGDTWFRLTPKDWYNLVLLIK